jgi:D-amino-acid oxidase
MANNVAIIGAGVSGLTTAVVFVEQGWRTAIFAAETGRATNSAAAAAIWYPYDTAGDDAVIAWALSTFQELVELSRQPRTGVSMIELLTFSRTGEIQMPAWAAGLSGRQLQPNELMVPSSPQIPAAFTSGFALTVPIMDTTRYLDYLEQRLFGAGGSITGNFLFDRLDGVNREFDLVINCAGIGAKTLVPDGDLEPHRGQVAVVRKFELPCAVVCDDPPLTYAIPRASDCVFGGTNELSDSREPDPAATSRIVSECSRVLNIREPAVVAERVGLRPFRKGGVCLRRERLRDGRAVIHNYGHGGSGFTLSWGCARNVFELAHGPYE